MLFDDRCNGITVGREMFRVAQHHVEISRERVRVSQGLGMIELLGSRHGGGRVVVPLIDPERGESTPGTGVRVSISFREVGRSRRPPKRPSKIWRGLFSAGMGFPFRSYEIVDVREANACVQ